ncbi:response regulator [Bremerella cremea]|uniref:response regulator n=1 Tax=Bremerella cremea TaxID=1031537 RepID=UPI0031EF5C78
MLVLSRSPNESIEFPGLGVSIKVLQLSKSRVRLGIDAPREIAVRRHELPPDDFSGLPRNQKPVELSPINQQLQTAIHALEKVQLAAEITDSDHVFALLTRILRELEVLEAQVASCLPPVGIPTNKQVRRALVVDDNENEARLLASFLKLKDFEVDSVPNGAAAIEYLSSNQLPDVVLLDMNMPKFNGGWTVREIRRNARFEDIKVFAVSGIHPIEYGVEVGPGGCDRWFQKPLNPARLVEEMLSGNNLGQTVLN